MQRLAERFAKAGAGAANREAEVARAAERVKAAV
jgi:hypothetical protein